MLSSYCTSTATRFTTLPFRKLCVASPTFFKGMPSVMAKIESESSFVPSSERLSGDGSGTPCSICRQAQKKGDERVTSSEA